MRYCFYLIILIPKILFVHIEKIIIQAYCLKCRKHKKLILIKHVISLSICVCTANELKIYMILQRKLLRMAKTKHNYDAFLNMRPRIKLNVL